MKVRLLFAFAMLLVACGPREAQLQQEAGLEFGNVAIGESHDLELRLTNTGDKSAELVFTVDSSDFSVDETSRTLPGGETIKLVVHFVPSALGPRTGTLNTGVSNIALSGRGIGPQLSAPRELTLGPLAIVTGTPTEILATTITLRNSGTAGSLLRLGAPRVEGTSELCVGVFSGSTCMAWQPPGILDANTLLEVPLSILPNTEGTKRWSVIFPSNNPLKPEFTMEVRANVETFVPCSFVGPTNFVMQYQGVLSLRHVGPGTCLVREVTVNPADVIQLTAPHLPLRLASNQTLDLELSIATRPVAFFPGNLHVTAAGTEPFDFNFQVQGQIYDCLLVSPPHFDFGNVPMSCNASTRRGLLYNTCTEPVVIESVSIVQGPEFSLVSGIPEGIVIPSGGQGVPIAVSYQPGNFGQDTGYLKISARNRLHVFVPLEGRSEPNSRNTDTYRDDPLAISDVLIMVDTSPSFIARRASVRENVMPLLRAMSSPCIDGRIAFAAADGAPDGGVRFQPNDAGERWTASRDPAFVEKALSALDSLPVGSEVEACIGPAADLIDDAGVRDGGVFAGYCVTDALESSPNPFAALQRLRQHARWVTWSSVAAFGGACGAEAIDDGVHQSLVTAGNGVRADICSAYWGESVFPTGTNCSYRTAYFLTSRPVGFIEVRVSGVIIPLGNWTYDAANNTVSFLPAFAPPRGATITISYDTAFCSP